MKLSCRIALSIFTSLFLSIFPALFTVSLAMTQTQHAGFASAEHSIIGDEINLLFPASDPGMPSQHLLHLPNGFVASYGEIIALGDFYGIPEQPISQGQNDAERRERFLAVFNSFANDVGVIPELKKIIDVIHTEKNTLLSGIERGQKPEDIYASIGHLYDAQWNCITGGGCDVKNWWLKPGRYLKLLLNNYDHFGDDAILAYKIGHQLALEQAAAAHASGNIKQLQLAYAMNAFACHFYTDRFAAGHMRTPRLVLARHVKPAIVGALLANYMHNEENPAGLHMHNLNGDHWIAFGDNSLLSERAKIHRKMIQVAIQHSSNEIFQAFQTGSSEINETASHFLPLPNEVGSAAMTDISTLFYWDAKTQKVMRRSLLDNTYDKNWTDQWWGWSTLLQLNHDRGLPLMDQATLARSELAQKALEDGLITDKYIIEYIKGMSNKKKK